MLVVGVEGDRFGSVRLSIRGGGGSCIGLLVRGRKLVIREGSERCLASRSLFGLGYDT